MDWADDVAYSVHDVEDGLYAGLVALKNLRDHAERRVVALVALASYCASSWHVTAAELETVFAEFMELPCWRFGFDGGPAALAAAKNLTSELVGRFCQAAEQATLLAPGANPPVTPLGGTTPPPNPGLSRYAAGLVVPRRQLLECALLKAVAAHYVMTREGAAAQQARERELIADWRWPSSGARRPRSTPYSARLGTAPPVTRHAGVLSSTRLPRSPTRPLWSGIDGWC